MKNNSNTCKNCHSPLRETDKFCSECSARVVKNRISYRSILRDIWITARLGALVRTLWCLLYRPQVMLKEYLNGTRRKYAFPFAFFTIIIGFAIIFYSTFSEELIQMSSHMELQDLDAIKKLDEEKVPEDELSILFGFNNEKELDQAINTFYINHFNLSFFLMVPFFALISLLVFRKTYNFWEQLIINMYLQGIVILLNVFLLIISVSTNFNLFGIGSLIITFIYYSYVYKKLYDLNWKELLLKILKLIGVLSVFFILFLVFFIIYILLVRN